MAPNRVQSCNPGVVLTALIVQRGSRARGSNWEGNWNENSDPLVEKCNLFHKYSSGQRGEGGRDPFFRCAALQVLAYAEYLLLLLNAAIQMHTSQNSIL